MAKTFKSLSDKKLVELVKSGAIGVIPTDTVYGLVCSAENEASVQRLYNLKSRENKPGTVIAASIDQLVKLGLKYRYLKAVEDYWPGAVSVVVPFSDPAKAYLRQDLSSLAVRIPKIATFSQFLRVTGPLLTTSVNMPGESPANNINEAQKVFGDKVDFYVDGGDLSGRQPSTIIRIVDDAVEVLRQGAVKI